jgi:hypothetical protein
VKPLAQHDGGDSPRAVDRSGGNPSGSPCRARAIPGKRRCRAALAAGPERIDRHYLHEDREPPRRLSTVGLIVNRFRRRNRFAPEWIGTILPQVEGRYG